MSLPDIRKLRNETNFWGWVQGLYLGGNDDGIALRLYHGYPYEEQSRALWRKLCSGAELVIDVGAHTGIYSLEAYQAGAKSVLSVEPHHLNFARLIMNLHHAGFTTDYAAFCAVGDENSIAMLNTNTPSNYCTAGASLRVKGNSSNSVAVRVFALDTLLKPENHAKVRAVKIDTEKTGCCVLSGMPLILAHRPDLILECTEYGLGELLKPLGYRFWRIEEDSGLSPVEDLIPDNPFTFNCPNRFASVKGLPNGD